MRKIFYTVEYQTTSEVIDGEDVLNGNKYVCAYVIKDNDLILIFDEVLDNSIDSVERIKNSLPEKYYDENIIFKHI